MLYSIHMIFCKYSNMKIVMMHLATFEQQNGEIFHIEINKRIICMTAGKGAVEISSDNAAPSTAMDFIKYISYVTGDFCFVGELVQCCIGDV